MEYLKETVRLGNGLDEEFNLTREAMQRGWDCLARFEAAGGFERAQVRAVATQTFGAAIEKNFWPVAVKFWVTPSMWFRAPRKPG